jgi:aspartate/methionine/tyrosine aminotransferase
MFLDALKDDRHPLSTGCRCARVPVTRAGPTIGPVRISGRVDSGEGPNAIAQERARLAASGVAVTDLSDSNPTRHGLLHPAVLEAVERHTARASRYDPHPRGSRSAREALAARFGGDADDYWLTASTSESYSWLLALLANPGEAVAKPAPGYPLVDPLARLSGVRTTPYRLHYVHPHGWVLDGASLEHATAGDGVRGVIVVNPGNPTGAYTGRTVDDIVAVCASRGLALIADEVFAPFVLDGSVSTVGGESRVPTFTFGGLSKLLCAPQLKLAWIRLSGPPADLPALRQALDCVADLFLPGSGPVQEALPELLDLADASVETTRQRLITNLEAARELFSGTSFRVRRCEGGWNTIIEVPRSVPFDDLALRLLRQARLAVHPGWFYDLASQRALVVSLLPRPEMFLDRLRRLRTAVEALAA